MMKQIRCLVILASFLLMIACGQTGQSESQSEKVTIEKLQTSVSIIQTATVQQFSNLAGEAKNITPATTISKTPTRQSTPGPRPTSTNYPTPWGPTAIIKASMPAIVPCLINEQNTGCKWSYSVSFESKNGIGGVVERIRRVYKNKNGVRYTLLGGSGWKNTHIIIHSTGITNFDASWSQRFDEKPDLRNGQVEITYEGHDDNGNFFNGTLSVILASNK